ncbi:amidase domain-containing protein [Nocardia vaccinii]|uniref:amidase domain-containing protein n=1 Tax=Nocardia vaccinii TaxID=1822 RepID=UPI0012F52A18|nr:amidase domain-containing protein [Nocardia vaccinii]
MDDIHDNGVRPLDKNWAGKGFGAATDTLKQVASQAEVASILARAVVDPLDTLHDAVSIAQRELEAVIDNARTQGLSVNETTGMVSVPAGVAAADAIHLMFVAMVANERIASAVAAAADADRDCLAALSHVVFADPAKTTVAQAQTIQQIAIADALQEMRDTLPVGSSPDEVAYWWSQLTSQQQLDLERACPVELFNLAGIPDSVKQQVDQNWRGYSSVAAVQWALDNYNDTSIDVFPNNCANFVSNALHNAGMGYKLGGIDLGFMKLDAVRYDSEGWGQTVGGEISLPLIGHLPLIGGIDHTRTWSDADRQKNFFLENGGRTVSDNNIRPGDNVRPNDNVRPGDVAYWEYAQPHGDLAPGQAHHTALVTAVLPDGQAVYTQHTLGATDYAEFGRIHEIAKDEGQQNVQIVAPYQTW